MRVMHGNRHSLAYHGITGLVFIAKYHCGGFLGVGFYLLVLFWDKDGTETGTGMVYFDLDVATLLVATLRTFPFK